MSSERRLSLSIKGGQFANLLDWVSPPTFHFFVEPVAGEKCKNEICYLINLFDLQLLPVGKVSVFQIMNWSMVYHILAIITRYNCLRHVSLIDSTSC